MFAFSFNPIATHTNLEGTFTFFEKAGSEKIYAEVPKQEGLFPVSISPKVRTEALTYLSSAAKIKRLLQGFFVQPTYQAEENAVILEPSSPKIETWKRKAMLRLPPDAISICRADGKISYAIGDTVTTWDWATDTYEVFGVKNAACITALAERSDGSLILGDEKGQLHVSGKIIDTRVHQSVTEILYFHDAWALIKYEKISEKERRETEIKKLNFLTGGVEEVAPQTQILALGDGSLIILDKTNGSVCWEQFDQTQRKFIDIPSRDKKEKIFAIRLASKTKVLLLQEDNKELLTRYDIETQAEQTWKNDQLWIDCLRNCPYVCLDGQTIAVGASVGRNALIKFYYRKGLEKEPTNAHRAGFWGVNAMITLSNGSIMYGTYTTPSGIHVVNREGKIIFTATLEGDPKINSLTELSDGSVAVRCQDSMLIFQPHFKNKSIPADNELKHTTYLASLEAAFKQANFYKARRYYEKAKKIKPSSNAHSLISLLHLKKSLNKKLYRQILLATLYGQKNKEVKDIHLDQEVSTWKNKTCKKRLFIGEGTFTFTEAFIKKHEETHPLLASSIVATELAVPSEKKEEVMQRVSHLRERGVTVLFGVDGQFLHNHFKEKRFKRIHWNCPFTGKGVNQNIFKAAIPKFFLSCTHLQLEGDRVHMTLMQEEDDPWRDINWKSRQIQNPIVLGATSAGYRLIRKRLFGPNRYPGYQHAETSGKDHSTGRYREFVFEKSSQLSVKEESEFLACIRSLENEFSKNVTLLKDVYAQYVSSIKESFEKRKIGLRGCLKKKSNPAEVDFSDKVKELEKGLYLILQQEEKKFEDKVKISNFNFSTIERRNSQDIQAAWMKYVQELERDALDNMKAIGRKYLRYAEDLEIDYISIYANLSDYSQEKVNKSKKYFIDLCENPKVRSSIDKDDKTSTNFIAKLETLNKTLSDQGGELKVKTLKIIKDLKILSLAYINALMDPNKKEFAIKIFQGIDKKSGQSGSSDGINFDLQNCYYECSSDEDSSDCYDSD
ncbi:Rossmann-like fold-containing protein [Neochlamydia sp. S13]|uniref:Rossmann-like fold-containing protein n=1 Tax=Neochlamydia sp. S13 TaxID=1353976 RepID=UPI0005A7BD98|nr:Rossmann-like fold-containing protein [Neochlamydia sp. S13]BBI18037.1 hypothetical protein NCS13_1_1842 [Neochlamydia sp. S13]